MIIDSHKEILFKNFTTWFNELATLAEQLEDSSSLPKLELSLRSGHVIRGSIIKLKQNTNDQLLMIWGLLDPYTKSEMTIVSSNEVVALTLLEPENYIKHFAAAPNRKIVSHLELKRGVKNIEEELEKIFSSPITIQTDIENLTETIRWDVLRTIGFLPSVITSITADELGKKQFKENIKKIEVKISEKNKTELHHDTLLIRVSSPLLTSVIQEKERI